VGEHNIICCPKCKFKVVTYWISMIPSYMFGNSFCEWLGKTNLCQKLRASRFKLFWETPLVPAPKIEFVWPLSHPTTQLFCHLYVGKKSFDPPVKHPLPS
jgi:hypothetical protein